MRAIVRACFNNRGTILMIRTDGVDDEAGLPRKVDKIHFAELNSLNACPS